MTLFERFHLNKIVILCFVGYIGYEIFQLYSFCQPVIAQPADRTAVFWDLGTDKSPPVVDVCVFLSTTPQAPQNLRDPPEQIPASSSHVLIGEFSAVRPAAEATDDTSRDIHSGDLQLPRSFYRNGTLHLHVLAFPAGRRTGNALRHEVVRISRHVLQADRKVPTRYLLHESVAQGLEAARPMTSLPKIIEVGFVQETRPLDAAGLREKGLSRFVNSQHLQLPLFVNTLVSPRDEFVPVLDPSGPPRAGSLPGEEIQLPSIEIRFRNIGLAYWTMQLQVGSAFDDAEKSMALNEYDVDSFKQMVGGSSPYKILLVYSIAVLHLVFEYLAFSSDLTFWKEKTSFEGMSSTSIAMQATMNIIMFLYVKEQQKTKFVMYFIGARFLMQLWKLHKLTTFRRQKSFPFVEWVNRGGVASGLEELEEIEDVEKGCMKWLMLILIPVMIAFSVYKLIYFRFRSWYSWAVLSLAVCAQTGGFVVMTPQVFMNYRLKSVEHLPWRALTYQAINTFIDDVFVLCIRMPEVQKYSVFRDDIIFLICCFQRWLYTKRPLVLPEGEGGAPLIDDEHEHRE